MAKLPKLRPFTEAKDTVNRQNGRAGESIGRRQRSLSVGLQVVFGGLVIGRNLL